VWGGPGAGASGSDGGELLATNLWNYTMPLVRYRVGDRGIASDARCGCGRPYPMLRRIVGRSEACLRRRDGGVVLPEFFIHLIGVETNDGAVAKFQVIQDAFDHVVVRAVPAAGRERDLFARREEIAARMCRALGDACRVEFVTADEIAPTPTGKHLYTVCTIGGRAT
jgi:phenylacetate-CoA ligase